MALGKYLIPRKPRGGCLEGRTVPIQPIRISCPTSAIYPPFELDLHEDEEVDGDTFKTLIRAAVALNRSSAR
jgi:hypothetical protein